MYFEVSCFVVCRRTTYYVERKKAGGSDYPGGVEPPRLMLWSQVQSLSIFPTPTTPRHLDLRIPPPSDWYVAPPPSQRTAETKSKNQDIFSRLAVVVTPTSIHPLGVK